MLHVWVSDFCYSQFAYEFREKLWRHKKISRAFGNLLREKFNTGNPSLLMYCIYYCV
jgi:hypothetical protein